MAGLLDYAPNVGGLLAGPAPQTYGGLLGNVAEWWRSQPSILDQMRAIDAMRSRTGDPLADFRADANNPELRAATLDMAQNFNFLGNMKGPTAYFPAKMLQPMSREAAEAAAQKHGVSPDWLIRNSEALVSKRAAHATPAAQFAAAAEEMGFKVKADLDQAGSAYVTVLDKKGRPTFKARFADHPQYYGASVSVDPVTGNSLDDALAALKWHMSDRKAPPPEVGTAYIDPGSGGKFTGRKPYRP